MELPVSFFNHDAQAGGFYPKSHVGIDVSSFGHGQNMLLEGIRGTGKTHVLKMVERHCLATFERNRVLPIFVSLAQINEHARKEPEEFRLHLYTHIVQRSVETLEKYKLELQEDKSLLQRSLDSIKTLFCIETSKTFDDIIKDIISVSEDLRFKLQFNLTSKNFKDSSGINSNLSCSANGKIGQKGIAEAGFEQKGNLTLSSNVEDNTMYVGSKLAHHNASAFLLEFLKQLQVILNLEHSLILLDECSEADYKAQVEIFRLFKAIRGGNSLLSDKNCCAHFIGSVYPQGATYYPKRNIDGFSFEPGHDCTVEFLEWDELDNKTYVSFFHDMLVSRLKELLAYDCEGGEAIKKIFEDKNSFLLAAYCANGTPRRFWEILKRGYDRGSKKISSKGVEIAIQEIANDQILTIGHLTNEDIDFINDIVDRLLGKNVDIRGNNKKNNINHPQYIYFSINRQHKHLLDRLVVQGAVHDKSRMRMKSKYTLKPIFSLDISLSYNFSIIPKKNFVRILSNEIPRCAKSDFAQAIDVKNNILESIYKISVNESDRDKLLFKDSILNTNSEHEITEAHGVIYSFVPGKFGFIEVSDGGPNAFFYHTQIDPEFQGQLNKGDKVRFKMSYSAKGRQGSSICKIDEYNDI